MTVCQTCNGNGDNLVGLPCCGCRGTGRSGNSFRSSMFWECDIEEVVQEAKNAASEYDPQDSVQFLRDVANELASQADKMRKRKQ